MTVPGIDVITAATLIAVIGDAAPLPVSSRHLVGYLGLHPHVRQSGNSPARHGRLSKEGSAAARHVLVEAAWTASQAAPGRCTPSRRASPPAAAAMWRPSPSRASSPCSAWHLLTRGEDYAFAVPSMVRRKRRRLELAAGAPRAKTGPKPDPVWNTDADEREHRLAQQAESAYRRLVADWQAAEARAGAGATPERAS